MNVETVNNSRDLAQIMTSLNLDIEERRKFIEAAGKAKDFQSLHLLALWKDSLYLLIFVSFFHAL